MDETSRLNGVTDGSASGRLEAPGLPHFKAGTTLYSIPGVVNEIFGNDGGALALGGELRGGRGVAAEGVLVFADGQNYSRLSTVMPKMVSAPSTRSLSE